LYDLELVVDKDLLAHLCTGKSLYAGHLCELELAVHEDGHAFVQLTPEKYNITGSYNIYCCTDIRTHICVKKVQAEWALFRSTNIDVDTKKMGKERFFTKGFFQCYLKGTVV
jgi:hypothetical protein